MLGSRRLSAIVPVLIVSVLAVGFILTDDFVQEATAQSGTTECDIAQARSKATCGLATAVCNIKGWDSDACFAGIVKCGAATREMLEICQN